MVQLGYCSRLAFMPVDGRTEAAGVSFGFKSRRHSTRRQVSQKCPEHPEGGALDEFRVSPERDEHKTE